MKHMGTWQTMVFQGLTAPWGITYPVSTLAGRAASYSNHYRDSFNSLVLDMLGDGYIITCVLGPHGGLWSSRWFATK